MQLLGVLQGQILLASDTATRRLAEDLVEQSRRADFDVDNFIEAAYAAVGAPKPAAKVSVDDVLALATAPYGNSVTRRTTGLTVEAPRYALALVAREMVGVLMRARLATEADISASVVRGKLVVEVVATQARQRASPVRLREVVAATFATVTALTGIEVSVLKGGRGVRAVVRAIVHDDLRPRVIVLGANGRFATEARRAARGLALDVETRRTSLAVLTELQEANSPARIAACVIDAEVRDDLTGRLYHALGRHELCERVIVVAADGAPVPADAPEGVRVVRRRDLPSALRMVLEPQTRASAR